MASLRQTSIRNVGVVVAAVTNLLAGKFAEGIVPPLVALVAESEHIGQVDSAVRPHVVKRQLPLVEKAHKELARHAQHIRRKLGRKCLRMGHDGHRSSLRQMLQDIDEHGEEFCGNIQSEPRVGPALGLIENPPAGLSLGV